MCVKHRKIMMIWSVKCGINHTKGFFCEFKLRWILLGINHKLKTTLGTFDSRSTVWMNICNIPIGMYYHLYEGLIFHSLTCQVWFPHPIRMVSVWYVGTMQQSFQCVMWDSKQSRWSAIAATHHQQQPQWLMPSSIHGLLFGSLSLCLIGIFGGDFFFFLVLILSVFRITNPCFIQSQANLHS